MRPQHLSDEAVAAFADGVLSGHARERAARHLNECPECRGAAGPGAEKIPGSKEAKAAGGDR